MSLDPNHPAAPVGPDAGKEPTGQDGFTARLLRGLASSAPAKQTRSHPSHLVASLANMAGVPLPPRTIACMVTHGMGQQVPFETVSQIADAFVRGRTPDSMQPNRVELVPGAGLTSRMEIVYHADPAAGLDQEIHLHLYEGYWAPLTEGQIGFVATLTFLASGAWSGIKTCLIRALAALRLTRKVPFSRWIFQRVRPLPIKPGTFGQLLLTVVVLAFAVALAYGSAAVLHHAWSGFKASTPTAIAHACAHAAALLFHHPVAFCKALGHAFVSRLPLFGRVLFLAGSAFYAYLVRYFVIEFVGDVAIYVSSYKVSQYQVVRDAIQKTVFNVATQLFQARTTGEPTEPQPFAYDQVLFLGHSLGSVITYDLLDDLIVWDIDGSGGAYSVVDRTRALITFGSPLDKTAFLFRTQINPDYDYREQLAGLEQPLILDYRLRPFPWINLYSPYDFVSGQLLYYDYPTSTGLLQPEDLIDSTGRLKAPANPLHNPVSNVHDPAARVPGYAHEQYWTGKALRDLLQAAIR